ncbi:patatin-like phospholipase family protein [Acidaminobacterium chupaoyuni]
MLGLALEGGGSRGAYHLGVYRAYTQQGFHFDMITGTSIGAVNAAVLAQGDAARLEEAWKTLNNSDIFDVDNERYRRLFSLKLEIADFSYYRDTLSKVASGGGVDTAKMVSLIDRLVDSDRLLASPVDFGLVTVCTSDLKPVEFFKHDIPKEDLKTYIMASATFPGFQPTMIDGKPYIDGGLYDNCPMTMLAAKGCDEIIAVRTYGPGVFRLPKEKDLKITVIEPSQPLGPIMNFDPQVSAENIKMGYYDALRRLQTLAGRLYYIRRPRQDTAFEAFCRLQEEQIGRACAVSGFGSQMPPRRALFEKLLPALAAELEVSKESDYTDLLIAMLENRALRAEIDRFAIFELQDFFTAVCAAKAAPPPRKPLNLPSLRRRLLTASDLLLEELLSLSGSPLLLS